MSYTVKQLLNLITRISETSCWKFGGSLDAHGFGRLYTNNKEVKAHRFFYELLEKPVPPGMVLKHHLPAEKCIGNSCCNPDHMQVSSKGRSLPAHGYKECQKGHLMTPDNVVTERRNGHPKERCRTCRQESWRKNSARRAAEGKHT